MSNDPYALLVNSPYRDALYGASYKGDLSNISGLRSRDAVRDKTGDAVAAQTESLLRLAFPNATKDQIDQAAYQALTSQGQGPSVRVMWDGKLTDRRGGFEKAGVLGYNSQANPYDIARRIGSYMGGISPETEAQFSQSEASFLPVLKKWEGGIDAADTKANGIGNLGGALLGGALTYFSGGLLGPVAAGALGGAVGASAGTGDINNALKGAVVGGVGGYAANKLGWNPQGGESGGFTLDAAMLDPTNAASGLTELTNAGTQAAAGDMATTAGAFESSLGNLPNQSIWDSATDWMKENPKTTYDLAKTGIGLLAGSQVGNQGGSSVNTSTAFTPFTPNQFQYAPLVPEWAKQKGLL